MSDAREYEGLQRKFGAIGMDVCSAVDAPQLPLHHVVMKNVRQLTRTTLQTRAGTVSLFNAAANKTPPHSIRCLNDIAAADYTYIAGVADTLERGKTSPLTTVESGYSGDPLTLVPYAPAGSTDPWMAVFDSNKMRKLSLSGNTHLLGLPAPTAPPLAELDWTAAPLRRDVDTGSNAGSWTGPVAVSANTRVNTAYVRHAYAGMDPTLGLTGAFFAVELASLADIRPGCILTNGSGDTLSVLAVNPASPSAVSATITRIIYDTGVANQDWCTIIPSTYFKEFVQFALIKVGSRYAAITHVIKGPDGTVALRCYVPVGVGTVLEGDTIEVRNSVYAYSSALPTGTYSGTATKTDAALAASGSHYFTRGSAGSPLNLNLSTFSSGDRAVNRKLDEMHIGLWCDEPERVVEYKIQADVDDGTFSRTYFTRTIRAADAIFALTEQQTSVDDRAEQIRREELGKYIKSGVPREMLDNLGRVRGRRDMPIGETGRFDDVAWVEPPDVPIADIPGGPSSQAGPGASQWFGVRFKMQDWVKVGDDDSKDLHNVIALRIVVVTNDLGTANIRFDDWYITGGYEPDVQQGAPYEYRYRYRASTTGAKSNWSPPSRSYVWPHRHGVRVTATGLAGVSECDKIDIQRRGGSVNEWVVVGSVSNATYTFVDAYNDAYAFSAAASPEAVEGNSNTRPFTIQKGPFTVNVAELAGSMARHGSSGFNTGWQQGTPVSVNGIATYVYRVHSTDVIEFYDHVGSGTTVAFEMPQQLIVDQPLPVVFGPVGEGWYYGLGDVDNPNRLYVLNQYNLDATQSSSIVDIGDAQTVLQNGCSYGGQGFVWSEEKMYRLTPTPNGPELVAWSEVIGAPGLKFRWAYAVGDLMYWLSKNGIHASDGGSGRSVTLQTLQTLFPYEGSAGVDKYGVLAPDFAAGNAAKHRLCWSHDKKLYYDYLAVTGAVNATLVLDAAGGPDGQWGWYYDTYADTAVMHYSDERNKVHRVIVGMKSSTTGYFAAYDGTVSTDAGSGIPCQVRTFADNNGNQEAEKRVGHAAVDIDPGNATITVTALLDNFGTSVSPATSITGATRPEPTIVEVDAYARNAALDVAWTTTGTQRPILYGYSWTWLTGPEDTKKRPTDYGDLGHWGPKELRGLDLEADTEGVAKTVLVEYTKEDGTVASVSFSVTTTQKTLVPLALVPPVICYEARIRPTDTGRWKFFEVRKWHFDPLTDDSRLISEWTRFPQLMWVQGVELEADTKNVSRAVDVQRDFAEVIRTIPSVQHNGLGVKAYAFNPFLAYMVRTAPQASARIMRAVWKYRPEAPLGTQWHTQELEIGDPYGAVKLLQLEYAANGSVSVAVYLDGTLVRTMTFATTGSDLVFKRLVDTVTAKRGKLLNFIITQSSGVRVRWNGTKAWIIPFGEKGRWVSVVGAEHGYGADV